MKHHLVAVLVMVSLPVCGGVTVVQNVAPGATSWPGSPLLRTMSNPSSATVPQTFTNAGRSSLGQTFTITGTNYTLQTISLYAGGGTGTNAGTNVTLRLYDLGIQTAPQPAPYGGVTPNETISTDLFGSGSGLTISYVNQANGVLQLDFTGADQVLLKIGHMYAFELGGTAGQAPLNWFSLTSGGGYSGGAAYTNKYWLNANNGSEFSMALYATVYTDTVSDPAPLAGAATVNWTNIYQRIDGFGGSSAWRSTWNSAQADMLFSTNTGIGLSLLRSRIRPSDGGTDESSIMQMAKARGARVWSSPWTPPTTYKDSGSLNGGNFHGGAATNQAYARYLASHVVRMNATYGVPIYAISVQNEPDVNTTGYESCAWTAQQIHDFVPYLSAALAASNVASTKIIIPESQHWSQTPSLYTTTMSDPAVAPLVGIIANHNYDGINADNTATSVPSQINGAYPDTALWETEVSALKGSYSSIYNGVYWAGRIHLFMTAAQANAWHHWWLITGNTTANQGLLDVAGNPTKRMYVMGHFSRFVRPDYYRIGTVTNQGTVAVSAYKDTNSSWFAIVAINSNTTNAVNLTLNLSNFTASSVIPWVTSGSLSLSNQPAVAVVNSSFSYTLPGPSVVTFVGQASPNNTAPVLTPVADVTTNAGIYLVITNVATDAEAPPQTLTFSLLNGPGAVDASSGVYTWRPSVSQADTTNLIIVKVADDGTPSLSATNSYNITINPLAPSSLSSVTVAGGQTSFVIDGPQGPDYTVWLSTNLLDWQVLLTTNSPAVPVTVVDTNSPADPTRFYRVEMGP